MKIDPDWKPGSYGAGKHHWHVWRQLPGRPQEHLTDTRGNIRRFGSYAAALRAATTARLHDATPESPSITSPAPHGPAWLAFLKRELGTTKWVVAARLTARLRDKGYTVAVSPTRYRALQARFQANG